MSQPISVQDRMFFCEGEKSRTRSLGLLNFQLYLMHAFVKVTELKRIFHIVVKTSCFSTLFR